MQIGVKHAHCSVPCVCEPANWSGLKRLEKDAEIILFYKDNNIHHAILSEPTWSM